MRHYPGISLNGIEDPLILNALKKIDDWCRDASRQLATQSSAGTVSSPGVVTSISANSGTDIQGDIELVEGNAIDIASSGQSLTIGVDTGAAGLGSLFLRRDGTNSPTADIPFGGFTLTGIPAADASGEPLAYALNSLNHLAAATGTYDMGNQRLTNLGAGTTAGDAISYGENPLNHLLAATGAYDMAGNTFTNLGGCTSSNAAQLNFTSNKTAAAGAGINLRWNAAAAVAAGYYPLTVQYDNATGTRDVMKVGYAKPASEAYSVLWLPDKDGGNDSGISEAHLVAGETNAYSGTGNVALRFIPNSFNGALWIYVGGELALDIRKSGQAINFTSGYTFQNNGIFKMQTGSFNGTDFTNEGSYQFGFNAAGSPAAGLHTGWLRGLVGSSVSTTVFTNHIGSLDYLGQFRSGQHGDAAQEPADGGFSAAGWYEASTSTNQTGADVYIRAGRGTGNSATKGDIIFQTPDAGASGTDVQAITEKWRITRAGVLTAVEAMDIAVGTTTGTKIGTATSQKLGFYNATPVVQRTDAGALTDSTGGAVDGTLVDVGAVPLQANINSNFADCAAKINALRTALRDLGLMA